MGPGTHTTCLVYGTQFLFLTYSNLIISSFLTSLAKVKRPLPESQEVGGSKNRLPLYLGVGAVAILVIGILFFLGFTRHKLGKGKSPSIFFLHMIVCPGFQNMERLKSETHDDVAANLLAKPFSSH